MSVGPSAVPTDHFHLPGLCRFNEMSNTAKQSLSVGQVMLQTYPASRRRPRRAGATPARSASVQFALVFQSLRLGAAVDSDDDLFTRINRPLMLFTTASLGARNRPRVTWERKYQRKSLAKKSIERGLFSAIAFRCNRIRGQTIVWSAGGAPHDDQVYTQGQQLPADVQALLNSPCRPIAVLPD